jgi:DNA-binding NarL/FixJ family response regulator
MAEDIRVVIVEDQTELRDGLSVLIGGTAGYRVAGAYPSMEAVASEPVMVEPPHVALLDIVLPGASGIEGVSWFKTTYPTIHILMLSVYGDSDNVFEAICAGASGYLLKDTPPSKLLDAIREVRDGGAPMSPDVARRVVTMFQRVLSGRRDEVRSLTPREVEVLRLLADGHTYRSAAAALAVSPETIHFHVGNIYEKLHVASRSEAVLKAFRSGVLR